MCRNYIFPTLTAVFLGYQYGYAGPLDGFRKLFRDLEPGRFYDACALHIEGGGHAEEAIASNKSMLAFHPHGVLCGGFSWNGCHHPALAGLQIKFVIASGLYNMPIFGLVLRWLGHFAKASKHDVVERMKAGGSLALIPGGFEEATLAERGVDRVYLKSRVGFIKYALQFGFRVHPVYSFGEVDLYQCMTGHYGLRHALNKYSVPTAVFWGFLGLFPRPDTSIHTVIGKAIQMPLIPAPTDADVKKYHRIYIEALVALYDNHKAQYGRATSELQVW